ncbi:DJ-1/PfpI family protein [Nocardia exalbida]|uniref:DJ-1/PfpI family protein n=1 Tax=Nocardia exalbida TaxID=290231 RepID=UPI0002EDDA72|nr:DJ-1/PfpI family protein [Nocardia exalbida]
MATTLQGQRIAILAAAGADVVEEEVAVDGNLISSRSPGALPAFCRAIVERSATPHGSRS